MDLPTTLTMADSMDHLLCSLFSKEENISTLTSFLMRKISLLRHTFHGTFQWTSSLEAGTYLVFVWIKPCNVLRSWTTTFNVKPHWQSHRTGPFSQNPSSFHLFIAVNQETEDHNPLSLYPYIRPLAKSSRKRR